MFVYIHIYINMSYKHSIQAFPPPQKKKIWDGLSVKFSCMTKQSLHLSAPEVIIPFETVLPLYLQDSFQSNAKLNEKNKEGGT